MNFKELAIIGSIFLSLVIIVIVFARNARKIQEIDPVALERARANLPQGKLASFWLTIKRLVARVLVFLAEVAVKWAKKLLTLAHYSLVKARIKLKKNTPLSGEEDFERQEEEIRQVFLREEEQEIKMLLGESGWSQEPSLERKSLMVSGGDPEEDVEMEFQKRDSKREVSAAESSFQKRKEVSQDSNPLENDDLDDFFSFQQEKRRELGEGGELEETEESEEGNGATKVAVSYSQERTEKGHFSKEELEEEKELDIFQGPLEELEELKKDHKERAVGGNSRFARGSSKPPRPGFLGRRLRQESYRSYKKTNSTQASEGGAKLFNEEESVSRSLNVPESFEANRSQEDSEQKESIELSPPSPWEGQEEDFSSDMSDSASSSQSKKGGLEVVQSWLGGVFSKLGGGKRDASEQSGLTDREELERVVSQVNFSDQELDEEIFRGSGEAVREPTETEVEERSASLSSEERRRREEKNKQKIQEQSQQEEETEEDGLEGIEIDLNILEKKILGQITKNPRDVKCYRRLGDLYLKKGNLNDALEAYQLLLKITPGDIQAQRKVKEIKEKKETVSTF
jgi:tetratricopeptide (TPR) repeat protein